MKEQLLWRIEYKDKGPFSTDAIFKEIQSKIIHLGPAADKCDTTFLNIYDQRTRPPSMVKEFRPYADDLIGNQALRFGFNSKEILEDEFGISEEYVSNHRVWFRQFASLMYYDPNFKVKVYLANPIVFNKTESIFDINQSELVETIDNIETFMRS